MNKEQKNMDIESNNEDLSLEMREQILFTQLAQYLPVDKLEFVKKAYQFAQQSHIGQKRASGEEYIVHPLSVVSILADLQLDADTLSAAFLHDVANYNEQQCKCTAYTNFSKHN